MSSNVSSSDFSSTGDGTHRFNLAVGSGAQSITLTNCITASYYNFYWNACGY